MAGDRMPPDASESHSHDSSPSPERVRVPDSDSSPSGSAPVPAPTSDTTPGIQHWGRVYAVVLAFLALLIALFAWLTTIYS